MTAPDLIVDLRPGEVFVFGSNVYGFHAGGAARIAHEKFGAVWGQGEGLQGDSYAIPTMEGIESLRAAVARFLAFAATHPELTFLLTPVGTGIAGYTVEQIAPLFRVNMPNLHLPRVFEDAIRDEVTV